jgi:TolB-like protein/tetratricopeptide (TPR) repeat protein
MVNSSGLLVVARKRPLRSASEYSPVLATWIACHGLLRAFSFSAYKTKRARMEGESTTQASAPAGAVFLSYASQDAEAAARICDALRVAGIEVWFDQSELRGGDAWDQKIRKQIKTCALFLPLISQHTHERAEGYFRLEWKLAVDRSHLIMANKAFLVPVVIDETADDDENVPEKFRELQWTRLPAGETPPAFVERVQRLLSPEVSTATRAPASGEPGAVSGIRKQRPASGWSRRVLPVAAVVVVMGAVAYLAIERPWISKPAASSTPASAAPVAFAPPPHSVAVLPFVNMSGDKEQEYFSDGLTEELLNSLARINELQVVARTSAFSFKGQNTDIGTIARKLNVASVLEGSVRRSGHTVRITAQLNNAATGYHLWSETYDRNLKDVLKLQTEIANEVATALKVTLLGDVAAKVEVGGTHSPVAFDAYLRGSRIHSGYVTSKDLQAAIAAYSEAIRQDPEYALAYAARSRALAEFASWATASSDVRVSLANAKADARTAIALAPKLAAGHLALANVYELLLEFGAADQEYSRALALNPGDVRILGDYGAFAVLMGRRDLGLTSLRRAAALDPLNFSAHLSLGFSLFMLGSYQEALRALRDAQTLRPDAPRVNGLMGLAYYGLNDLQAARSSCEGKAEDDDNVLSCLAVTYRKLGRHADAEAMLARMRARDGDSGAMVYSLVYTQWGNTDLALDWLETAMRLRHPLLEIIKMSPALDPVRKEPRFQAIERELKFPS